MQNDRVKSKKNDIDNLILGILKKNSGTYVSGQALSSRIKITRTAIWKHIEGLRRQGYIITSTHSKGYQLISIPDRLLASEIERTLKTRIIGKEILTFDEVDSTNIIGMDMGSKGGRDGLVIVAETQRHGKGRLGRTWISPRGNIYASILLRPDFSPLDAFSLTMLAAVAASEAISETTGLEARIKWPNDLLIGPNKVAGILTEMNAEEDKINYVVMGIGINVNMKKEDFPDNLRMPATSLEESLGQKINRMELLVSLLDHVDSNYGDLGKRGIMSIIKKWRRLCVTLHKKIRVTLPGEVITGVAEDITEKGGLVVRLAESATKTVYSGDITLLE